MIMEGFFLLFSKIKVIFFPSVHPPSSFFRSCWAPQSNLIIGGRFWRHEFVLCDNHHLEREQSSELMWILEARIWVQTLPTAQPARQRHRGGTEQGKEEKKDGEESSSSLGNKSLLGLGVFLVLLSPEPCSWVLDVFSGQYNYREHVHCSASCQS